MIKVAHTLTEEYLAALVEYVAGAQETALIRAYEIGRRANEYGLGVLDVVAAHQTAFASVLMHATTLDGLVRITQAAGGFLTESLAPFEMTNRGFREANAALQKLNQVLGGQAVQLEAAKEVADRANRAKSEFLSRMSHELRTPLNAVIGFAQLLGMDTLTNEQQDNVEHILKGGRHLLDLINEVLDISRIEVDRLAISPEPVPVKDVVQESLELIAPLAIQRGVRLHNHMAETSSHVRADRQRLKQVLLNLLSNAVKYNRPDGTVTLSCDVTSRDRLRIIVSDTGPGIPAERLDRLFTPFDRLGAEQTGVEGTGLGLAFSKKLVELMDGEIGAKSEVGRGSTFWVELSLVESPIQQYERVPKHEIPAALLRPEAGKIYNVLYVEDNLSNLELVQRLLADRIRVKLLTAMQGQMGLDLAREHHPDLILLDLHLPDIPGDEVLRRLREDPGTSSTPVIMISADATPGQMERLLAEGAGAYLTKPLDLRKLLGIIEETLRIGDAGHAGNRA